MNQEQGHVAILGQRSDNIVRELNGGLLKGKRRSRMLGIGWKSDVPWCWEQR